MIAPAVPLTWVVPEERYVVETIQCENTIILRSVLDCLEH